MSRSMINTKVQLTFIRTLKKTAILSSASLAFGINGFGNRAYDVRLDPAEMFKISTRNYHVPSFEEFITYSTIEIINGMTPNDAMVVGSPFHSPTHHV